jgi:hypothetical protein
LPSDVTIVESAMTSALIERYGDRIAGVLSCYDRIVVTGTLPTVCYAEGMTRFLYASRIRIFEGPSIDWGIMNGAIRPVGYIGGWGLVDGMDATFGWSRD